ncbi:MAG: hypothetical protein ABL956_06260 [Hyphomonadaceae bacterium]
MLPWIIFTSSNLSVTGSSGRGGWGGDYTLADNRFEFKAFSLLAGASYPNHDARAGVLAQAMYRG